MNTRAEGVNATPPSSNVFTRAMSQHGASATVLDDYGDALAFLFGAPQHDRHVQDWRQHLRFTYGYYAPWLNVVAAWNAERKGK